MKKLAAWSVLILVALSLTACATTTGGESVNVKCPTCGYQFDINDKG